MIASIELPGGVCGLATGRGTAALIAAVEALDLVGREILVPVNLCAIAVAGMLAAGARPVLHDVSAETGNTTLELLKTAWRPTIAGLLAVHNFGEPLDMRAIANWGRQRGLRIIEDVCNAIGAKCDGAPVGTLGDAAIYSFGAGKIIDVGEGGAVAACGIAEAARLEHRVATMPRLSDDTREAAIDAECGVRQLRRSGAPQEALRGVYRAYLPHIATRLDPDGAMRIDAALSDLAEKVERRRRMAQAWSDHLARADIARASIANGAAPWRYNICVTATRRDAVVRALRAHGHSASTWYPPVAELFANEVEAVGSFPGARAFAAEVVNLWVDTTVDEQQIASAAAIITELTGRRA